MKGQFYCWHKHKYLLTPCAHGNVGVHNTYHILLVNSRGYYKFQVEIDVVTNRDFIIKIVHKLSINL